MNLRLVRPTRRQLLVLATVVAVAATVSVAGLLHLWSLVVVGLVLMLLVVVVVGLYSIRVLSARINHQTVVLSRAMGSMGFAPTGSDGALWDGARRGAALLDQWSRTLLSTPRGHELFLQRAKRTRSLGARDLLAHSATRGTCRWAELGSVLEGWRSVGLDGVQRSELERLQRPATRTLARLLYSQRAAESDLLDAVLLYDVLVRLDGLESLSDDERSHYADLCVDQHRFGLAQEVLAARPADSPARAVSHELFAANAVNPHLGNREADEQQWLARVNALLARGGFAPLELLPGDHAPFQRLTCTGVEPVETGPLVSVLMPVYEPDEATDQAIGSVLAQSWRRLELIVVDDGSPQVDAEGRPTGHRAQLRAWAARDPRVRLVLNEDNHGAYWVRNQAYDLARGEFVTVADKDDWHHPQQIEWQVRDLQSDRGKIANLTSWARVSPQLRFLVRWGPDRVTHPSFASLMFRREPVRERLGYWDTVRKGADNEFRLRMQLAYGVRLNPSELTPLTFSLMGEGNLTSTDLGLGYEHEDRGAYRHSYLRWHDEIGRGAPVHLGREPGRRPFPAPTRFLPERGTAPSYDVVHVVELDSTPARNRLLRAELDAAVAAGLRVGVIAAENFSGTRRPRLQLDARVDELVQQGRVTRLAAAEEASTALLVVRTPSLMQICRDAPAGLTVLLAVVLADEGPSSRRPVRHRYEVHTVAETVRRVFGVEPEWAATTEQVRDRLLALLPPSRLRPGLWGGSGDAEVVPVGPVPITVGGHDDPRTRAWTDTLRHQPVGAPGPELRVAGLFSVSDLHGGADDLDTLDVWVCLAAEPEEEMLLMAREALARGVALLLDPGFTDVFGDSALYATAEDAVTVLARLEVETGTGQPPTEHGDLQEVEDGSAPGSGEDSVRDASGDVGAPADVGPEDEGVPETVVGGSRSPLDVDEPRGPVDEGSDRRDPLTGRS